MHKAMKPKEIIIKTFPNYRKERYFKLYSHLLEELLEDYNSKTPKKPKLNNDIFTIRVKKKKNYWNSIIAFLNEEDTHYLDYIDKITLLELKYLKSKVSQIFLKMKKLAKKIHKKIDYVIKTHLDSSQFEFNYIREKQNEKITKKSTQSKFSFLPEAKRRVFSLDDDDDNEKKKQSIVNLFIGNFDVDSLKKHHQTITMKRTENMNTFIFKEKKEKKKSIIWDPRIVHAKTVKEKEKDFLTIDRGFYTNSGRINVHRAGSIFVHPDDLLSKELLTHNGIHHKSMGSFCNYHSKTSTFQTINGNEETKETKENRKDTPKNKKKCNLVKKSKQNLLPPLLFVPPFASERIKKTSVEKKSVNFLSKTDLYY